MKIEVTQEDIDRGNQSEASTCAVARSIRRTTGRRIVLVEDIRVRILKDNFVFDLPEKVRTFINKFDNNRKSVKPFSFELKGYKKAS